MCVRQRGVSSELIALLAPVEPIFDRLPGLVIGRDHFELGEWNRQFYFVPVHLDEHIVFAILYGCHADHLDLVSHLQRRGGSPGSTPCKEGEVDFHFDVVISAYDPFLFVVGIDDGLHGDPVLSDLIRFDLGSSKPLEHCDPLQACGTLTAYHKHSGLDAQPPKCRHIRRSTTAAAPSPSTNLSEACGQATTSASLPSSRFPTFASERIGSGTLEKLPRRMFLSVSSRNPSSRRPP